MDGWPGAAPGADMPADRVDAVAVAVSEMGKDIVGRGSKHCVVRV
jgi:hypothetical protein